MSRDLSRHRVARGFRGFQIEEKRATTRIIWNNRGLRGLTTEISKYALHATPDFGQFPLHFGSCSRTVKMVRWAASPVI
jgi:hypothetical protein